MKTIKQVLGIKINHVIDINFGGFKALVDYLGCIYVQVDRRYYHSNLRVGGQPDVREINIQPGYQKLCGQDALDYVRYRHAIRTSSAARVSRTSCGRSRTRSVPADLIVQRWARSSRSSASTASTDIRSTDEVLQALELVVQSAGHPVRQVVFNADPGTLVRDRLTAPRSVRRSKRS